MLHELGSVAVGVVGVASAPVMDETVAACAGERIAALRESRGLSVMDLALTAGMIPDHLRAIEAGLCPTVVERQAIAAALDVNPELLGF